MMTSFLTFSLLLTYTSMLLPGLCLSADIDLMLSHKSSDLHDYESIQSNHGLVGAEVATRHLNDFEAFAIRFAFLVCVLIVLGCILTATRYPRLSRGLLISITRLDVLMIRIREMTSSATQVVPPLPVRVDGVQEMEMMEGVTVATATPGFAHAGYVHDLSVD